MESLRPPDLKKRTEKALGRLKLEQDFSTTDILARHVVWWETPCLCGFYNVEQPLWPPSLRASNPSN